MASIDKIQDYHAHVYYDATTKPVAQALRQDMERLYPAARYGRWHDRPVGPHPDWSFQIAFTADLFAGIVPYLAINRGELVIFIHPNTDDASADHRYHAIWMGAVRPLDLSGLGPPSQ
jgi:aromatic ring-cleaving dioxygenase